MPPPGLPEAFERAGAKHLPFTGHCSERHVAQLAHACNDDRPEVVIGVGGGALLTRYPPKRSPAVWRCVCRYPTTIAATYILLDAFPSQIYGTTRDRRYG